MCTSAETLPEIREFERTSTAAANAYLMPVIERYLDALVDSLRDWGYDGDVLVTHSGGGVMSAQSASQVPARICHSGPAGGVVGGALVGKSAGVPSVITFDMGGTSADLSLVYEGRPSIASEWRVDWNIPILFPAVDLGHRRRRRHHRVGRRRRVAARGPAERRRRPGPGLPRPRQH